jgi:hypothetical protein
MYRGGCAGCRNLACAAAWARKSFQPGPKGRPV